MIHKPSDALASASRIVRAVAAVAFVVLAGAGVAAAQTPAPSDDDEGYVQPIQEVFQTELVYPQDRGEVQLTLGPRRLAGAEEIGEIPVAAEYGITDRWQVEVEYVAFSRVRLDPVGTAQGRGDVEVGTKYAFMNIGGSNTHAAVGCDVELPSGDVANGLGEGLVSVQPFVCVARDLPSLHRAQLFAELGLSLVHRVKTPPETEDGEGEGLGAATDPHELDLDVGAFVPVGKLCGTMELNWTTDQWNHHGATSEIYVTPGVVWDPVPGWEFGVGVAVGVSHDADRARVIGTVIYEFDTIRHKR
jgi:hypothetical protein